MNDRNAQINQLCERASSMVPNESPLIVGGDFNDWREKASSALETMLGLEESFFGQNGQHAKTFPSWLPILRLDRLYFRGLSRVSADLLTGSIWRDLSDHLPILAEFEIETQ